MMKRKFIKPLSVAELKKKRLQQEYEKQQLEPLQGISVHESLDINVKRMEELFQNTEDLVIRELYIGGHQHLKAAMCFIDGLTNPFVTDEYVIAALTEDIVNRLPDHLLTDHQQIFEWVKKGGLHASEVEETREFKQIVQSILSGDSVLFFDQINQALIVDTKGWATRGVQEPNNEQVIRGPRDGFTETLRVNTALIRRRIRDPQLRLIHYKIGERTQTDVGLMYIEGLVDNNTLQEVKNRIENITFDGILESGYIEQFIEDHPWSPFPQVQYTERPDKAASHLLEGKVVILVDGSPFVLIVPAILIQFYHSPEDYYERFIIGSLVRFIRVLSFFFALLLPSLYIAFTSFHPEMIPSKLVIAMAAGRATVPFPAIVEAVLMEIAVEILREASVRLPGLIGPTIGIVGALVIGEAAVQAGLVSPIMVIVVGLTTISSFVIPNYSAAIALRMLRFPMMFIAGTFGLYGIMVFVIMIIIHLCSLKSFNVPYTAGFSPARLSDFKDSVIRSPLYNLNKRPTPFNQKNIYRQLTIEEQGGDPHATAQNNGQTNNG
ncbi:GerA spore germination protein [Caldalkalibacillus thermarum TA2.A1]|uniref:Spore germination protein n=1 Tax=Caldalkalibacillus thermarum (strain TA2.A1) TaxID=986075 RepID=F5L7E7_CALTT|nr:spore germination protein [Caldalkalibacillus thermarum]EGL82739.1 GerA spore germination protein [Caldalkalibacillus thermarum TA2.A1]QZT32563.1 spore germination protein [Caldalkalibacillus thermarum TA2.A1]